MILGYCMQLCAICGRETNHRIMEPKGKLMKECVNCRGRWRCDLTLPLFQKRDQPGVSDETGGALSLQNEPQAAEYH
jgi:hypothetical protein